MRTAWLPLVPGMWMALSAVPAPRVVHIAPEGTDQAPGTAEAPIRSLSRLQALLSEQTDITEVVFHQGVYYGSLAVPVPKGADVQHLPRLLIHVAKGEEAILDGGLPLREAEAVPGAPGVYVVKDAQRFRSEARRREGLFPGMWDAQARRRYQLVADLRAVAHFPATFCFMGNDLYVHTDDGRPPREHHLEVSSLDVGTYGLTINRPNTTVRGLKARHFHRNCTSSAGFCAAAENVTIEECSTFNCPRGFRGTGPNVRILRCRAEDCGGGALINSKGALVEDCVFIRTRDAFMTPMPLQEDTGIEVYHPAGEQIILRGNVCKGFTYCGIFIKCEPGEFLVERNTLVENGTGLGWSPSWGKNTVSRHNIFYGNARAVHRVDQVHVKHHAYGNCVWPAPFADPTALKSDAEYLNTIGEGNFFADPRLVAPEANDFRLLPDSPCRERSVGALGAVSADFKDVHPPRVRLADQPTLAPAGATVEGIPIFAANRRTFPLWIRAHDAASAVARMRLRVGEGNWGAPVPYQEKSEITLPADTGTFPVAVQVADAAGNWSDPATICIQARVAQPALLGEPTVRANRYGVAISFPTNVECFATGEVRPEGQGQPTIPLRVCGVASENEKGMARRDHVLGAVLGDQPEGAGYRFHIRLTDKEGTAGQEFEGRFRLSGGARQYTVALDGEDTEEGGTPGRPWRTVQYAVDRALPGDTIVVRAGLYTEPTLIVRGGVAAAPLVIRAEKKWEGVLDGHRRVPYLFRVVRAPYVQIEGFEMRWYGDPYGYAVSIENSPDVTLRACKIWNAFWHEGRAVGTAVRAVDSPGVVMERNLIFRNDTICYFLRCPRSRIVSNTMRGHVHGGLGLYDSIAGTVVRNNCLTFPGNYAYQIQIADPKEFETFDADYNNLGTCLRHWRDEPGVAPNLPPQSGGSKNIALIIRTGGTWYGYLHSGGTGDPPTIYGDTKPGEGEGWEGKGMTLRKWVPDATTPPEKRGLPYWLSATIEDWREFSGKEKHSIFADPRHVDPIEFDFRLLPDSPNIGAGENGTTIGAMEVAR